MYNFPIIGSELMGWLMLCKSLHRGKGGSSVAAFALCQEHGAPTSEGFAANYRDANIVANAALPPDL